MAGRPWPSPSLSLLRSPPERITSPSPGPISPILNRLRGSTDRDAQGGVMMEAALASALIVPEPESLLELLIVALDPPAQLSELHEAVEGDVLRQGTAWQSRSTLVQVRGCLM